MPRVVDYHFPQRFLHLLPLGNVYARTDVARKVCFALGEHVCCLLVLPASRLSPFFSLMSPQRREPIVGYPYQFL
jgi:hypothetical protein